MRALAVVATAATALALAGTAAAAGPLSVAFKPQAPGPKVGVKWPYTLTVKQAGKPAKGTLTVTLVDPIGQVHPVEDDAKKPITNRAIAGVFRDKILFPAEARGFTLTLRFAVTAGGAKKVTEVKVTPK